MLPAMFLMTWGVRHSVGVWDLAELLLSSSSISVPWLVLEDDSSTKTREDATCSCPKPDPYMIVRPAHSTS